MNETMPGPGPAARGLPAAARGMAPAARLAVGVAAPVATVGVVLIGVRVSVAGGLPAVDAVAFAVTLAWAAAASVCASRVPGRGRAGPWPAALGALDGAVALTAARVAGQPGPHGLARGAATVAGLLVIAASVAFVLSAPDGRLGTRARRGAALLAFLAALGTGLVLALAGRPFPAVAAAVIWPAALLATLPAARARYRRLGGHERERMQWLAVGAVLGADAALVFGVLHLLVGWPGPVAAVMVGVTAAVPAGLVAGTSARLAPVAGRLLVHVLSLAGFSVVVAAIYLIIVLGLGQRPGGHADREILGLSMLAAAVTAVGYLPARDRLMASATRFVYGAREAPDEALRTFGSRMTRAVAMDELLLQLAESLRKTMALTSAEVYSGSGDVLERTVSVPDAGRRSIIVGDRERPVITRAGVSGNAWASIWLPALLEGRPPSQLRVAPISHAGELLGLLVVQRPEEADTFTEEDDRVLTELARQAGLAFYNVRLDAALQTTLDELRRQADELRESRARIVASGDAERRRVERDLHDGAQQHLVALAVTLRLARDILAEDPETGAEMLAQMADDVQATIRELRELAHGIYPPLLADNGLGDALRAAANRSPLAVTVTTDGIGRYSEGIETAIYFCCLEALQNAGKHAAGATVQIRLWEESGGLLFSVGDDGPGFDAAQARGGHGFVNMSDRLGAIGGTVRWESQPGHGATISGSVPVI